MHLYPEKAETFTIPNLFKTPLQKFPGNQCGKFLKKDFIRFLGPFDICIGGSKCIEGVCLCSAGKQLSKSNECEITNEPILIFNDKSFQRSTFQFNNPKG